MVFQQNEIVNKYLYSFSIFSILSILFFETTELTQLSVEDQLNSFGTLIRYVEPEYVKGVVLSFLQLNSYLIIFTTSFVGAISFKFLISLFGIDKLILFLTKAGLPVDNQDFQTYLLNLKIIGIEKFIFILLLFSYISYYIIYKIEDKNIK